MKLMLNNLTKTKQTRKKTIGQGGQAKIRKYYSNKYKEYVVEKVINIESSTRATLGERGILNIINLLKEAVLLSGFKHQNIVKIYDYKEDPPRIIMEYCAKGSLRSILDKHIFSILFIKYI
jgi:serine/threonine protein kinase